MEEKTLKLNVEVSGFEKAEAKTKSLKSQLKELKQQLGTLDENSDEFKNLVREAGALEDKIGDINLQVKNFASDTKKLDVVVEGFSAVAGGVALTQGAMGLLGDENKNLEKQMMKVQSALALVQGAQALSNALQKETTLVTSIQSAATATWATVTGLATGSLKIATVATRVWNAVMSANPILLIVAGIGALIGAFTMFSGSTVSATEKNDKLNASLEATRSKLDSLSKDIKRAGDEKLALAKISGATSDEINKIENENFKKNNELRNTDIKKTEQALREKRRLQKQAVEDGDEDAIKAITDELNSEKKKWSDLNNARKDAYSQQRILNAQFVKDEKEKREEALEKEKEARQKSNEDYKKKLEERKAIREKIQDIENSLIKDDTEKKIALENTRFARELEDAKGQAKLIEALKKEHKANLFNIEQESMKSIGDSIKAKDKEDDNKAKAKQQKELDHQIAKANYRMTEREREVFELQKARNDDFITQEEFLIKKAELEKKYETEDRNRKIAEISGKLDIVQSGLQAIGGLVEAFAGKSKKQQERAFKVQKAINIASVTVDTAKAAMSAFASGGNPIVGAVLAAIAVAFGVVQIAKISKTKFDGGGGGGDVGGGGGAISMPTISSAMNAPQVGAQNATGVNQLPEQAPIKAYVVTGDMTSGQAIERNKIADATL